MRRLSARRYSPGAGVAAIAPHAMEVRSRSITVGDGAAASIAITGYPGEVSAGWLEPLFAHSGRLDVSLFIDPLPSSLAAERLRTRRVRLESSRRAAAGRGGLEDPEVDAAAEDAADLAARLARGHTKLFRVAIIVTIHADTEEQLSVEVAEVRALIASLLLEATPLTWRQREGWASTLPLGIDQVQRGRTMDTVAISAVFPFASPDIPISDTGVLYGTNLSSAGVLTWDRWAQDNHNSIILARSGAGKSFLAKTDLRRSLLTGVRAAVVDPEDEYSTTAEQLGGIVIRFGKPGVFLNPLDLPENGSADAVTRQALFVHTLIAVMLGGTIDPSEKAALDGAIIAAYRGAGITSDPRTHYRPAPLLADLHAALLGADDPVAGGLARRLTPFVSGSYAGLFAGPTTHRATGHLVVFSLRDLPEELRPIGSLIALDAIWRRVTDPTKTVRDLVVVDEAWQLLAAHDGATWLFKLAKSARKHATGLSIITQDVADVLATDVGRAIVANSATQLLLRQAPQAIDHVVDAFGLTAGERGFLLSAGRGEALLVAGSTRVAFAVQVSASESAAFQTTPDAIRVNRSGAPTTGPGGAP